MDESVHNSTARRGLCWHHCLGNIVCKYASREAKVDVFRTRFFKCLFLSCCWSDGINNYSNGTIVSLLVIASYYGISYYMDNFILNIIYMYITYTTNTFITTIIFLSHSSDVMILALKRKNPDTFTLLFLSTSCKGILNSCSSDFRNCKRGNVTSPT